MGLTGSSVNGLVSSLSIRLKKIGLGMCMVLAPYIVMRRWRGQLPGGLKSAH